MTKALRKAALCVFDALTLSVGFATALLMFTDGTAGVWRVLVPLCAAPLCVLICLAPSRARLPLTLALAAASGAAGWLLAPFAGATHIAYALLSLLLPLVALPLLGTGRMTITQVLLILLQIVVNLLPRDGNASLEALRPIFLALGVAQIALFLFHINLMQLREQCGGELSRVLPGNLGMTAVAVAVMLLLANLTAVWNAIKAAVRQVVRWVLALMDGMWGEVPATPPDASESGLFPRAAQEEPSRFWTIVEYVVLGLIALLALYLLLRAAKRLPALLRRLWGFIAGLLRRYRDAVSADYTDETQALQGVDARRTDDGAFRRLRRRLTRPPDWRTLNNRQRVREVYRRLCLKAQPDESLTAREALTGIIGASQLAEVYDRARYSVHEISDAEAQSARAMLKK